MYLTVQAVIESPKNKKMKHLYNRLHTSKTQFIFHERGTDAHVDNITDVLTERTQVAELTEERIHELAHQFAELLTTNEDFAAAFEIAVGEQLQAEQVDTWINDVEAHLISTSASTERAVERGMETPGQEPSGVAMPLSNEEFDEIYDNLDPSVDIPDDMRADIEAYVLHNLETSADPDDAENTERLDTEEINRLAESMIINQAIFLKTVEFGEVTLNGDPINEAREEDPEAERVSDVARRISEAFDHVSPQMLMRAMAGNHEGFGVNEEGEATAITEDSIRELAESLNGTGAEIDEALQAEGLTPGTPAYQQAYNQRMNQAVERMRLQDVESLADLIQLFLQFINPEQFEEEGGPFDDNGRPLGTTTPRGNYRPRGIETDGNHVPSISLHPDFYGDQLKEDFADLPENFHDTADLITQDSKWGPNTLKENLESGADINGWRLAVMRNAVNSYRYNKDFSAEKPFFANDLGTYRALIYYPGEGTTDVPCYGGSGGISNVSESHGSPLGSFNFSNATDRGSHRYGWSATVNGMEPMRSNYRTDYDEGPNIDPGAGNTNSAGRAILMHGANGRTWGCWGIPREEAIKLGQVIQEKGGGNGEAFVSTG